MKISILAVSIELDEKDEEPDFTTEPVRKPFTPDDLFAYLIREACKSRNPEPAKPDGPFFKV